MKESLLIICLSRATRLPTCLEDDASDPGRRPARAGVHEDQTILVAAPAKKAGFCGFSVRLVISGPGTLMKHEGLSESARAGSVRDVDNGDGGSERAGPPSGPGGPVRSIRKSIVLPGSGPTDLPVPVHLREERLRSGRCPSSD